MNELVPLIIHRLSNSVRYKYTHQDRMLSTIISFATLALLATASPLAERQSGVQVVRNCNNQGQVALTFDGMSPLFLPSFLSKHIR